MKPLVIPGTCIILVGMPTGGRHNCRAVIRAKSLPRTPIQGPVLSWRCATLKRPQRCKRGGPRVDLWYDGACELRL